MPKFNKLCAVLFLAMFVSACGNAAKQQKPVTGSETSSSSEAAEQEVEVASSVDANGAAKKETASDAEKEEELAALTYDSAPLQPEVNDDPAQLLGINGQELTNLLGAPTLVRTENPAEIWQYSTKNCVLDLVLYDSITTYVEARDEQVQPMDKKACLRRLLLSRQ